jgi:hypothetical protein
MRERFLDDIFSNRANAAILSRWRELELRDGWLVAGCLFQTVWNRRAGLAPDAHMRDHDVFYFDPTDLTEAAERAVQARVEAALADLGVVVEAKNQARVHLWYAAHFGFPYPRLSSTRDAIDRFIVRSTCVGVRPAGRSWEVYAPYGLDDLYAGRLDPNPLIDHRPLFEAKARSYAARWPWLRIDV